MEVDISKGNRAVGKLSMGAGDRQRCHTSLISIKFDIRRISSTTFRKFVTFADGDRRRLETRRSDVGNMASSSPRPAHPVG